MTIDFDKNEKLWVERYRPTKVDDVILQARTKKEVKSAIKEGHIPNLMFYGPPGCGKTTLAKAMCRDAGVDWILINGSNERGIDVIREKIVSFASTASMFGSNGKVVIIDECLEENEKVRVGTIDNWKAVALKDLKHNTLYPIISFNMNTNQYENDIGWIISDKEDDLYEVELEDGRKVKVTGEHPFICYDSEGNSFEMSINDGLNESYDVVVC